MHPLPYSQFKMAGRSKSKGSGGFSMIELIVVMTIFITLTTVMLFNYNSMNSRITLDTLAHQIAQWVRQTQVSAMSVKSHSGNYNVGYGLHFDRTNPNQFIFFYDLNNDKTYTPGGVCGDAASECVQTVTLPKGNTIVLLCAEALGVAQGACAPGLNEVVAGGDIVFIRPDTDAHISIETGVTPYPVSRLQVTVSSVKGYKRSIDIWTTGQASVL